MGRTAAPSEYGIVTGGGSNPFSPTSAVPEVHESGFSPAPVSTHGGPSRFLDNPASFRERGR